MYVDIHSVTTNEYDLDQMSCTAMFIVYSTPYTGFIIDNDFSINVVYFLIPRLWHDDANGGGWVS